MAKIPSRVGSAGTGDGPRRSARQARATQKIRASMSTGSSTRSRPTCPAPAASTGQSFVVVQEPGELPSIIIDRWRPAQLNEEGTSKASRPTRCLFCRQQRKKCVKEEGGSCQNCLKSNRDCTDKEKLEPSSSTAKEIGKAQARKAVNTSARRSGLAPQHPEIREALFRSFQNRTSPADTPHQKGSSLPAHLDRARRQIPELTAEQPGGANTSPHHSQSRSRSSFPSRSGERSVTGPRPHEHDTDIEMTPADSLPLDSGRASSLEIISEGEYRVALESRQSLQIGERMTFKKEPEDANYGLGPGLRLSNVGGFLRSIGLDHLIPAFHNVGLKTQDHLRKLIENVKDQARMEELRRLLPTKTVSLPVWWDIQDALMKEADNVHK